MMLKHQEPIHAGFFFLDREIAKLAVIRRQVEGILAVVLRFVDDGA